MKTVKLNGELISKAVELIEELTLWRKLSDFYNSRSTTYCSLLDSDLFEICRDSDMIVKLGFDKRVKAIVIANTKNKLVKQQIAKYKAENKRIKQIQDEKELAFKNEKKSAKIFMSENKELVKSLKSINGSSLKGEQKTAWILSLRASNKGLSISKRAFFYAL